MWYTFFGAATTIIVSLLVTKITGDKENKSVDLKLIAPIIRKYYAKKDDSQSKKSNKPSIQINDESVL